MVGKGGRPHDRAMIVPLLSVSLIGIVVALNRRGPGLPAGPLVGAGLAGAWIGFLAGGALGALVDVFIIGGFWPFLVGHAGALAVARLASGNRARALPG